MESKISYLLILFITIPLLSSCAYLSTSSNSTTDYYPQKIETSFANPLMGWAPSAEYTRYEQPHTLVYANLYWNELEPTEGNYDWGYIEKKYNFDYWKSKNVKIIFRVILDYPSDTAILNIPDWLYEKINGDGTWYDIPYGKGFSPNYDNEILISYHQKLIQELANRYNQSSQIAFIALGSLGHWGEWHTYEEDDFKIPFVSEDNSKRYIEHYTSAFTNKSLLLRTPNSASLTHSFGLFNDVFGSEEDTEQFLEWIEEGYIHYQFNTYQPSMIDFWLTKPSGGEFANGNSGIQYLTKQTIKSTLEQIKNSHITFIGPNCPANQPLGGDLQTYFDQALSTMGYRFTLHKTSILPDEINPKKLMITIELENEGIAPIYENWPVQLFLINSSNQIIETYDLDVSIMNWTPGKHTIQTEISLKKSVNNLTLGIAILDPATNQPAIRFANDDEIIPFVYKIGNINSKKSN